jgi:signal transduction histidine kinase
VIAIERARLYERISSAEEQLRRNERLCALGLLAAEVAHEIRNPLTVMKMLYHSLDLQFPPGDMRAVDARIMGQKMDHLNRIVDQILDFARTAEPRLELVSLSELLEDLRLLTRHKLRQQAVELALKVAPDTPLVQADAVQLEQAFLNLILNALEAMSGGGTLSIFAGPTRESIGTPAVRIEFADTGPGMRPQDSGRAFGSILSSTKPHGTGLGLAIVARVVESHRGTIRVDSAPGRGARFEIILPVNSEQRERG